MKNDRSRNRNARKPNTIDLHVGSRIKLRRMLLGMSQENLGDCLGLTFQQVQKYEKGVNRIGASRLFELANALGVNVQFFYDEAPGIEKSADVSGFAEETTTNYVASFMKSREGVELNRAFAKISNAQVRRSIVELVRAIANDETEMERLDKL
ncbi:MAG: helix-turn-helix transcriptional regulator [Pseudomonadota bacterium]